MVFTLSNQGDEAELAPEPEPIASPDIAPFASPTARFFQFIEDPSFPCVGSKAARARDAIRVVELGTLGCPANDARLLDALSRFGCQLAQLDPGASTVHSLVAVFDGPLDTDETRFEQRLWAQLQRLHDLDVARGNAWADDVATDPDDPRFSLSLAGHPFFVIGLHPGASRMARRFSSPCLVFNSHRQFEKLRQDGRFEKMRTATRKRDEALQGSINPNLADFGMAGETRQYSGRKVGADWKCPFHFKGNR